MKTFIKTALATAALVAAASAAHAESYTVTSVPDTLNIKVTVQGAGTFLLNNKTAANKLGLSPTGKMSQTLTLNDDHTFTGSIAYTDIGQPPQNLFVLTGSWDRPLGGRIIYIAVDGDPTDGAASDGTFGALFDPGKAALANLQAFMPVLFNTKMTAISPLFSTIKQTGTIKLDKLGTAGKSSLAISGRGVVDFCKMNKITSKCDISKGQKDVTWGFSAASPVSVVDTTPL